MRDPIIFLHLLESNKVNLSRISLPYIKSQMKLITEYKMRGTANFNDFFFDFL